MNEFEERITRELDMVIRLLALDVTKGRPLRERVLMLNQAGFTPKEIADILGKTSNSVRVMLFKLRKEGGTVGSEEEETNG